MGSRGTEECYGNPGAMCIHGRLSPRFPDFASCPSGDELGHAPWLAPWRVLGLAREREHGPERARQLLLRHCRGGDLARAAARTTVATVTTKREAARRLAVPSSVAAAGEGSVTPPSAATGPLTSAGTSR